MKTLTVSRRVSDLDRSVRSDFDPPSPRLG
jgi:hypothetical protein